MRPHNPEESKDMDESSLTVVTRSFNPETDQAFIYSSWRNSAFYGVPHRTEKPKDFFKDLTTTIRDILRHATVWIACLETDPLVIVGYSVATGSHLDWIYVKVDFRKKGIGKMLFPSHIETVTNCLTEIGSAIVNKKKMRVVNGKV